MRRLAALAALAACLLLGMAGQANADWRPYRHVHYVNSYLVATSSPDWLYQVVGYYHLRMNGSSPGYIPLITETAPMDCRVPYANFYSIAITRCNMIRQTQYAPDRWLISVHWRQCFGFQGWPSCAEHGMSLQLRATGYVTARSSW